MIGKVLESSAVEVIVKMDFNDFEKNKNALKIGKYLKIQTGNFDFLIATIKSIKAIADNSGQDKYLLSAEPVGVVVDDKFIPGSTVLPSPTEPVDIADKSILDKIFLENDVYSFALGRIAQNSDVILNLDGNAFFGKHIGIVGSTGSGKSCTVAKILQEAV